MQSKLCKFNDTIVMAGHYFVMYFIIIIHNYIKYTLLYNVNPALENFEQLDFYRYSYLTASYNYV